MWSLGLLLKDGKGVPPNLAEAYLWIEKAATKGHEPAKLKLCELAANLTPADLAIAKANSIQ
jgi:TPR repeat protein